MPRTVNLFSSAVNGFLAYLGLWELQALPRAHAPGEKEQPELSRKEYLRLLAAAGPWEEKGVHAGRRLLPPQGWPCRNFPC